MWNPLNRNFGLDAIRAIAIILVVASHSTFVLPQFNSTITQAVMLLGATGVDIFFVLSGYLIGGLLIKNLRLGKTNFKDLIHFWKRRWLRTLPNYFVILFLNVLLLVVFNESLHNKLWLYVPFLQNFTTPHPNFFTEAWSLSIEEYAYVLLPLLIYISISVIKPKNPIRLFFWVSLVVIFILFLFKFSFYQTVIILDYKDWSSSFRKVVLYRLDAIYYGFITVFLIRTYSSFFKRFKIHFLILGIILFLTLHLLIVSFDVLPNEYKLFYSLFYLALISLSIAFVFPWFLHLKGQKNVIKIIRYISTRSYAIYLINYSLVLLTLERFISPSIATFITYLLFTLIISELLYRYVERPFLKYRESKVPR